MLESTIVLPVDVLGNDVTVDETFTRANEFQNKSVYEGPVHTLSKRSQMTLSRTYPKKSGNFPGVARTEVKFSEDVYVPGNDGESVAGVEVGGVYFNLPAGTTSARALALRERLRAALDHAFIELLTEKCRI